jgi:serine/threonine-protein kinase
LELAHRSGIVHGDVKPANLLVRPAGRVVLTDFGIARIVAAGQVPATERLIGTAAYLAPEQVSGGQVTPATDVYSLGVVAYECLTMTRPFIADSSADVAAMHTPDEPRPLPRSIPPAVQRVVMRALANDPEQRWPTAHAMAKAAADAARELPETLWSAVPPELATAVPAAKAGHPAPTAALPTILDEPRGPRRLWAGLIPIAAGVALVVAASAIALRSADAPSGIPVPPASSVAPGDGTLDSPHQTDPSQPGNPTADDRDGDGHGGNSGPGGGGGNGSDNSGPG